MIEEKTGLHNLPELIISQVYTFTDTLNGWATSRYIWQTTDGGANWIERIDIPVLLPDDIYFPNLDTGWVGRYSSINNSLFKTTDGGQNWISIPEVVGARKFYFFPDPVHWLIIGFSQYYWTNDYGNNWVEFTNDVPIGLVSFSASSNYLGFAAGDDGLILKYNDTTYIPVELISFEGRIENNKIVLTWITATELNNYGFEIQKLFDNKNWQSIGFMSGKGTSTEKNYYSFSDPGIDRGMHYYRLKQIDHDGSFTYSKIIAVSIENVPLYFNLFQNYPNPFNNSTIITYQIPTDEFVSLKLFDVLGREIKTVINENKKAGYYSVSFKADDLSSGIYFYKLTAGEYNAIKKLILLK